MHDALVTFLNVSDLDRADNFYRVQLGLDLVTDQGACRIYRVAAGGYLGVCSHAGPAAPEGVIVTLVRDDVEGYCAAIAERGVAFEKPPTHNERFGITHAFLRDPDGHLVEVQRFDDPGWNQPVAR